jgi:hypothetical protein
MTNKNTKLRLGPLPRTNVVKLTITVSAQVKTTLDRYASFHSQLHGESVDALVLIPHMLESFIENDRGFKSLISRAAKSEG